jgi:DNA-binding response OmpR family regulator
VRILVCEPQAEVRELLRHVVERLGHEAVFPQERAGDASSSGAVDIVLLEPADPEARSAAEAVLRRDRRIPAVCASIDPDSRRAVGLRPLAYLVKPFGLSELERALTAAVSSVTAPGRAA